MGRREEIKTRGRWRRQIHGRNHTISKPNQKPNLAESQPYRWKESELVRPRQGPIKGHKLQIGPTTAPTRPTRGDQGQKSGETGTEMRRLQERDAGETSRSRSQKWARRAAGLGGRHGLQTVLKLTRDEVFKPSSDIVAGLL